LGEKKLQSQKRGSTISSTLGNIKDSSGFPALACRSYPRDGKNCEMKSQNLTCMEREGKVVGTSSCALSDSRGSYRLKTHPGGTGEVKLRGHLPPENVSWEKRGIVVKRGRETALFSLCTSTKGGK